MNEYLKFCQKEIEKNPDILAVDLKKKMAERFDITFGSAEAYYQRHVIPYGFETIKKGQGFSQEKMDGNKQKSERILEAANELKKAYSDVEIMADTFYSKLARILAKENIKLRPKSLRTMLSLHKFKLKTR